ncbi:MAG: class I SAM-dependent methyltransferase [Giesbergeria sp.]|uniref:class I SAM-dependent methyltransferase n=1 Tax=Giesbergeria sp. TaxID=2818473 RepID=UPI002611F37D|nr:class I SAM-dependent methyltransferase [Giesbergeria sp.]MDD2610713.1 class I SAM-dependent methyltransferase [Giesbergeria sp.]
MSTEIIDLHHWFDSAPGRYLLQWEQGCFDAAVADIFGYHALQIGMPLLDGLQGSRIPQRWRAAGATFVAGPGAGPAPHVVLHSGALPFADNSLDLVLLPHTLELSPDPHAALREVARVLLPEGRVVISGINPLSLWGLHQRRCLQRWGGPWYLPEDCQFIAPWRLRDWLQLLSFEVGAMQFGCYRPALRTEGWLRRFACLDRLGPHAWPILGAGYFVVAIKRVHGMRLLEPAWRHRPAPAMPGVSAINRNRDSAQHSSINIPDRKNT